MPTIPVGCTFEIQEIVDGYWQTMIGGYDGIEGLTQAKVDLETMIKDTGYDRRHFRIHTDTVPN